MASRFVRLVSIGVAMAVLCLPVPVRGQPPQPKGANLRTSPMVLSAFRSVVSGPSKSTVRILCGGKEAALGTVVTPDGYLLTKFSELEGTPLCRFKDGRELEARIVGVHDRFDLALLKVEASDLTPVDWADSKSSAVGHWLASPGLGDEPVAVGVLSVAARNLPAGPTPSAPNPDSGYLGVSLDPNQPNARIDQVMRGGAAEKAGLKVNDCIIAADGKPIDSPDDLINLLLTRKPGDVIELKVKRGEEELELKATLGKRPASANRGDMQNRLGSELSRRRTGFPTILQHDAVIKPSDCGGPVVNLDGKTIGINIARAGRTESYAIPTEAIRPLLKDLMSGKLAPLPKEEPKKPVSG